MEPTPNSSTRIVFFDVPTTIGVPTSPNTWKVRLVLNFKQLKYTTRWVPISSIESVCKSLNIPPTGRKPNGDPHYTLPALIDYTSDPPVAISDSTPIMRYLDQTYPTPSRPGIPSGFRIFTPSSQTFDMEVATLVQRNLMAYAPALWFMAVYQGKLPKDKVNFRERMEGRFGRRLEEIGARGEERESKWREVEDIFRKLGCLFDGRNGGASLMLSCGDFELAAWLVAMRNMDPEETWERHIRRWGGGRWETLVGRFEGWMYVDCEG